VVFLAKKNFEEVTQSIFDMQLDEAELFVAFILEDLREKGNSVVVSQIDFDRMNNSGSPLNYEAFQAILLIKIGVHELLHSFDGESTFSAFLVILDLLVFHVVNDVLQLLEGKDLGGRETWCNTGHLTWLHNHRRLLGMNRRIGILECVRVQMALGLHGAVLIEIGLLSN
jgi:hypothetical protein